MAVSVRLPTVLRPHAGGKSSVKVEGTKFVPAMIAGTHSVFTCFKLGSTTPIAPSPGTPGA